ncbi:MAG: hypothetical protein JKY92_03705, partial [Magnetovibrio sp.]|nr:hypothetical protein [Magnetovibrio sp.]
YKMAQALDVEVSYFYDEMPSSAKLKSLSDNPASSFDHDPMIQPESIKLVHNYFRIISPAVRNRVFQLVKSVADQNSQSLQSDD